MGLLDGKVAIVTGAGGGIGRCHALLLAREGAKVVVNDLGVQRDGSAAGQRMADQVVAEIKAQGGQGAANYDSVATVQGAAGILKTALDAFGRADILVNNAGILRDKTLLKLDEESFDIVIAVHLKGTYALTKAFAEHVKERAEKGERGGRIINTSSYAGLIGNFGQTNYAAAKAGIYGMTKVWSLELAKFGVTVNCIAPMAKTRMTEDITAVPETMLPEQVAPMVLYLASDLAGDVNGRIFGIHGQQLLEYRMLMTEGLTKPGKELWTPQEIHDKLAQIAADKPGASAPATIAAAAGAPVGDEAIIDKAFSLLPKVFLADKAKGWKATIHFDIAGASPWTVMIDESGCKTEKGKAGTPTCVVNVDKATYAAILTGQEKPEKAFMAGKIKASNLGDMMKFGGAFDMKKAREMAGPAATAAAAPAAVAAPQGGGDEAVIEKAFTLLPQVFLADKAKGWKATIHFDIQGTNPWTVKIDESGCKTEKGKTGAPTCVVTVDKATYAAVLTGQEKPEKAFMAGKIKATNLGDMMKFGGAFDMKKAREIAGPSAPSPQAGAVAAPQAAAGGPAELVTRGFEALPQVFQAQHASGWKAAITFEVTGAGDFTVSVADGKASVAKGKAADATCVVKTTAEDYAKLLTGELKAEQAFMQRRLTATNLGDMMKFGRAFDMKKAQELLKSGAPAAAPASAPAAKKGGLNRALIGRRTASPEPQFARPEHLRAYALSTLDENPAYLDTSRKGGVIAPPLFAVRLLKDALFRAVGDPELGADLMRLVHGEQDMEFLRPLRPWDLVATRAEITGIEEKSTGELLHLEERLSVDGELAVRVRASMFIRDPGKKKDGGAAEAPEPAPAKRAQAFKEQVTVTDGMSLRYADASLDNNPIHTDADVAKLAGFPGVILQGLCTMALAQRTIVNAVAKGDPTKLRRLAVRFSKPVLIGDALTIEGWDQDEREGVRTYGFHVVNQKGDEVIKNGVAEVVTR
jgi:NAD(P)-dependent dehydrogenase (short-subunit alcohol dehydrogenase family)/acyl dehydratase/putative sterol carrier protein